MPCNQLGNHRYSYPSERSSEEKESDFRWWEEGMEFIW